MSSTAVSPQRNQHSSPLASEVTPPRVSTSSSQSNTPDETLREFNRDPVLQRLDNLTQTNARLEKEVFDMKRVVETMKIDRDNQFQILLGAINALRLQLAEQTGTRVALVSGGDTQGGSKPFGSCMYLT